VAHTLDLSTRGTTDSGSALLGPSPRALAACSSACPYNNPSKPQPYDALPLDDPDATAAGNNYHSSDYHCSHSSEVVGTEQW